jgi:nitronate monooxygenase
MVACFWNWGVDMANVFSRLVGIKLPIVQAAMGGATSPQLAAAVSNAGGLGMLALGWSPPDAVRAEIRATKALTKRPFGVNLVLTHPQEERLAICLEEGVPVISFFWGQAGPLTDVARSGGAKVLHTAASAEQARISVDEGADVIVAQGWEAGGHVYGTVATMALVPAVVDEVSPIPVLAAGGIADGRGLAAAMALGAAGRLDRHSLSREQ